MSRRVFSFHLLHLALIGALMISVCGCSTNESAQSSPDAKAESGSETVAIEPEEVAPAETVPDKFPVAVSSGGDGYSIVLYEDLENETDFYPWKYDDVIAELPVYQKKASNAGVPWGVPKEKMNKLLDRTLGRMKLTGTGYESQIIGNNEEEIPYETVIRVSADTSEALIDVDGSGYVRINFKEGHHPQMPPMMNFSYNATEIEARAAMEYLASEYFSLTDWAAYDYDVGGDYTAYGEALRHYRMWAKVSDPAIAIQNYAFRYVEFYPDESGGLASIAMANALDGASSAGNYPLISVNDAADLLLKGYCLTTVPSPVKNTAKIPRTHLIYRNNPSEEYMIPFYRFYVDITDEFPSPGEMRSYGIYDVPAVKDAYLIMPEMPVFGITGPPEETPVYGVIEDPEKPGGSEVFASIKELGIKRIVQENGYYCGPACVKMILDAFGKNLTQTQIANQLPTYWPNDRKDGITGTFDTDIARVLSIHLFGAEPKSAADGGYRVQALSNSYNEEDYKKFCERLNRNINDGYPSVVQVNPDNLYSNSKKFNLDVVVSGNAEREGVSYFIILDPYFEGTENGRSIIPAWQLFNACISSVEPSYIW